MFIRKAIISILLVVTLVISLTAGIASAQATDDGIEQFVSRMYTHVLNRNVNRNYSGLQFWSNHLRNGTESASSVAQGFFFSNEFVRANHSNDVFINRLYRAILGREADARGSAYWTNHMNNGMSRERVLAGFIDSREFGNLARQHGIERGTSTHAEIVRIVQSGRERFTVPTRSLFPESEWRFIWEYGTSEIGLWEYLVNVRGFSMADIINVFEQETFRLINIERTNRGLNALRWDNRLANASRLHSQDLAGRRCPGRINGRIVGHTGSDGSTPTQRARRAGFSGEASENVAFDLTPRQAVQAWMDSPGHRANLLAPNWRTSGMGFATTLSSGTRPESSLFTYTSTPELFYFTQKFGR